MVVSSDRGQLLLSGAFVLAVTLIGLTVVLNAGNYSSTLASQEQSVVQGSDAISVSASVRADLVSIVRRVNDGAGAGISTLKSHFRENLSWYGNATSAYHARYSRLVNVSQIGVAPADRFVTGARLTQSSGQFVNPDDVTDADWIIDDNVKLRAATFTFRHVSDFGDPAFTIVLNVTGGHDWTVKVFDDASAAAVVVNDTDGSFTSTCTRATKIDSGGTVTPLTVDLSEATVGGDPCPALEQMSPAQVPYNVTLRNGTRAEGAYRLTVDEPPTQFPRFPPNRRRGILYSATVQYRYQAPGVNYVTELTVAPGEIS